MRVLDDRSCYMTELQELLIKDLFSLSTSVYTEVHDSGEYENCFPVQLEIYGMTGSVTHSQYFFVNF